jgi:hypothetical protein
MSDFGSSAEEAKRHEQNVLAGRRYPARPMDGLGDQPGPWDVRAARGGLVGLDDRFGCWDGRPLAICVCVGSDMA